jgi:thymidine kinase
MELNDIGYLELFVGPMWSGKTSELVRIYKQCHYCEMKILSINYVHDKRYSDTTISTHDKIQIPCVHGENLSDISDILNDDLTEEFENSNVILINEGQFFKDIVLWVKKAVDIYKKRIYICGLDGDFQRLQFNNWLGELIPFCDKITKLTSICGKCKISYAIFTHRITREIKQEVIGIDNYIPLCRKCYLQN